MNSLVVTGGAGFIGSHTCLVLLENGYDIYVLDNFTNSSSKSLERVFRLVSELKESRTSKLEIINCDIRDEFALEKAFLNASSNNNKIDAVIHFAGLKAVGESNKNPLSYWDVNVNGTTKLLQTMSRFDCKTIVFSSSATVYGNSDVQPISEENVICPSNPYGQTKATIERILEDVFNSDPQNWKIANLRYFNPVGAHPSGQIGENPMEIPNNIFPFITQVAIGTRKRLEIFGNDWPTKDGTGIRDYIHVMDLASAHMAALKFLLDEKPQIINLNLGTGKGTSVLELVNTFQRVNSCKIPFSYVDRRLGDVAITIADSSLALAKLDWRPERTLEEMCRDGWKWQLLNPQGYV